MVVVLCLVCISIVMLVGCSCLNVLLVVLVKLVCLLLSRVMMCLVLVLVRWCRLVCVFCSFGVSVYWIVVCGFVLVIYCLLWFCVVMGLKGSGFGFVLWNMKVFFLVCCFVW